MTASNIFQQELPTRQAKKKWKDEDSNQVCRAGMIEPAVLVAKRRGLRSTRCQILGNYLSKFDSDRFDVKENKIRKEGRTLKRELNSFCANFCESMLWPLSICLYSSKKTSAMSDAKNASNDL